MLRIPELWYEQVRGGGAYFVSLVWDVTFSVLLWELSHLCYSKGKRVWKEHRRPCRGKVFAACHLINFNTAHKLPQNLPFIVSFQKFNATLVFESSYMFYFPLLGSYLGFFWCVLFTVSQLIHVSLDNFRLSSWELVCCCSSVLRPISRFCIWQLFFSLSDLHIFFYIFENSFLGWPG